MALKPALRVFFLSLVFCSCFAQNTSYKLVGGPCEGCEAVLEFGDKKLKATDTLPGFNESGPKMLLQGTVYENDGVTPAEGVILYVYHTDQEGIYPTRGDEKGWARRHGYLRGWVKTNKEGEYSFYTLKPASYPSRTEAAHVHITVLEPDGKYYWISSFLFEGDPLLTNREINQENPRGGTSGLVRLEEKNGLLFGERDIYLGVNIPGW